MPAWDPTQVKEKDDVKAQADLKGLPVHFADLMALCFLKNVELEKAQQKYKGRVVLRGDNIKNQEGWQAVFTEQGASASQMVGAKTLDAIARMPGMAGSAADAVSAYTQVKMAWAQELLKLSEKNVLSSGFDYLEIGGLKSGDT